MNDVVACDLVVYFVIRTCSQQLLNYVKIAVGRAYS